MTSFTVKIADDDVPRVTAALCAAGGYDEVTTANALAAVKAYVDRIVQSVEQANAEQAALATIEPPIPVTFS